MRIRALFCACLFASIGSELALADIIDDPKVEVRDPAETSFLQFFSVPGLSFSFTCMSGTCGSSETGQLGFPCMVGSTEVFNCQFANASGSDWITLRITITPGGQIDTSCLPAHGFSACTVVATGANQPNVVDFFGGAGILFGTAGFAFSLIGWEPGTQFTVQANVPEPGPATLVFIGTTACLLLVRRKRLL